MTLDLDTAHVDDDPFSDFVENASSYDRSRNFWLSSFIETIGTEATHWHPWMTDPLKDGHPIFSVIDEGQTRAAMLQQVVETEDPIWFKCWMSKTMTVDGEVLPYLGMQTSASSRSLPLFHSFITKWIREKITYDQMLIFIDNIKNQYITEIE